MSIDPRHLRIEDFTYDLPGEKIAKHPLEKRDQSKLLVYRNGEISQAVFQTISNYIPNNARLIFNTTRVVRARLIFERNTGAQVEIFCTDSSNATIAFSQLLGFTKEVEIRAFVGNGKRWKNDEQLQCKINSTITVFANRIQAVDDQWIIKLSWQPAELTFADILEEAGKIPLPPYIDRDEDKNDSERYQTVFAKEKGSVAAPTAGLHFTDEIISQLKAKGIQTNKLVLHVGAGTFKPVKAVEMNGHDMHREQVEIPFDLIAQLATDFSSPIVAVGTTAARTMESLYWFGRQLVLNPGVYRSELYVSQWEPYSGETEVPVPVALRTIVDWMQENKLTVLRGYTQLMIAPGYSFKLVKGLVTNFHQPQSTLLLLVAAFIGKDFRKVYDYALKNDFRFLSYGDSSLLWRN
jgi:S-adenosylmethionine:tRNA ribosyltransferase-isomerase